MTTGSSELSVLLFKDET